MKINSTGKYDNPAYVKEMTETKRSESRETQSGDVKKDAAKGDTVKLSTVSKDIQTAIKAATEAPEVRSAEIDALKAAINEGRYEVNPDKIAEKMVHTMISDLV